ncbi:hypothetical protein FACS189420_7780 [Bacteroidia bacterium]|nr:hypothetical protein FACS189420_7780 [Bacteroidia bacterium]
MKYIPNELLFEEAKRLIANKENVIMRGKGSSMYPYLREGKDAVVLSPFQPNELKKGVIALFQHSGRYILHRIVERKINCWVMQGDGVFRSREEVPEQNIIAIVHTVVRSGGKEVSTRSAGARLYWYCWYNVRPFRRYLLAFLHYIVRY